MIISGQKINYKGTDYNLISHETKESWVYLHVKKRINCRVCKELNLKVRIENDVIDWDTLRKS